MAAAGKAGIAHVVSRTVSLAIDAIAAGGDGVARNDGLVVFVPRTAPGDVITASISGKGHFARGSLRTILRPSSDRVTPSCPHYTNDRCGGCQIQHIGYSSQLSAKQRIISDAMMRIGKREIDTPEITPSADEWRYRTKLTLAMHRRAEGWIAGLHPYDDPGRVFPLVDCPITDRRVVSAWREIMAASELFPGASSLRGSVRWTDDGPIFVLMGGTRWNDHSRFFDSVPTLAALYWEPVETSRKLLGDRRVRATPGASFAQVNPVVASVLRNYVLGNVLSFDPVSVTDAYSGAGDLAIALASRGVTVTAIELDADAARWAEQHLAPPSQSIAGRVEEVLPRVTPAEVVVLNPPRSGLHSDITEFLEGSRSARAIIYVSCDPATLARDIARLPGYAIRTVRAFDMFPQTSHVETVCVLTPAVPDTQGGL
jgi:23S rRNA (uracil1939-C5)-methyltransferase